MTERKESAFAYAKGKIFIKLAILFLSCIAAMIVMVAMREDTGLILFPAMISLIPAGIAAYYAVLFKKELVKGTVCHLVEKKKDVIGGLVSGLSFSRNRFYFEYENEKGEKNIFQISRGGLLNTLLVGQCYLVLHKTNQEPSSGNFIECVTIKDENA